MMDPPLKLGHLPPKLVDTPKLGPHPANWRTPRPPPHQSGDPPPTPISVEFPCSWKAKSQKWHSSNKGGGGGPVVVPLFVPPRLLRFIDPPLPHIRDDPHLPFPPPPHSRFTAFLFCK